MGEFQAGKWLMLLTIYFICLISSLSLSESFANEYDLDYNVSTTGDESLIGSLSFGKCQEPRSYVKDGEIVELNTFEDTLLCEFTKANVDLDVCNAVSGCSIQNDSFLWWTSDNYCGGEVNLTGEYNVSSELYESSSGFATTNVSLQNLLSTREQCEFFGFTWSTEDNIDTEIGVEGITSVIGGLFTFRATFSTDYWWNFILTTILFYIPFIALLLALYFALPFLH